MKGAYMQAVFENIIDKLEEQKAKGIYDYNSIIGEKNVLAKAIEIVKQEAVQYNNDQINQLAMMYAKNLVQFGVDITKIWDTAIQQTAALNQAYIRGRQDERDRFEQYNNGWIACTDRLPTREEYQRGNGRFLVTDGNRTYEAEFDIYESHTFGKSRMSTDWFVTDKCVTHWQNEPLPPKPYQPKGE